MAQAPVCHVPQDEIINQPSPNKLPPIPIATDLESALAAIAAMRKAILQLTNRDGGRAPTPFTPQFNGFTSTKTTSRWTEDTKQRVTKVVRVKQKDNPENFVDVEQINGLTFVDNITKEKFTWKR